MNLGRPPWLASSNTAPPALTLLLILGLSPGCGGHSHQGRGVAAAPAVASSSSAATSSEASKEASKDKEASSPPATSGSGVIARSELRRYLAEGPQTFIQRVQVRPAFREGRFYGWRIIAYGGPGPVRVGDIVRRVNHHGLERPEQFMKAWEELSRRSELVLELVRRGRPMVLRWSVEGP